MKLLAVDNYIDFECIGGDCPVSCCGGNWGIPIDDESYEYYMSVDGDFGETLRNSIVRINDTNMFRLDDVTKDCVFLNENKLCTIYKTLGPDALCSTCSSYPRSFYDIGGIRFCFLTNSCPEVNRMIMQRKDPLEILYDDSADESNDMDEIDKDRFNDALKVLSAGVHMLQNRNMALRDRLTLLLLFVERFQDLVKRKKDVKDLINILSEPTVYSMFLEKLDINNPDQTDKVHVFMKVYTILMENSYKHAMWERCEKLADDIMTKGIKDIDMLERAFCHIEESDIQTELEQLMTYRFFASFMKGFEKTDYIDKLVYEVVLYSALISYIALTGVIQGKACTQDDRILFYSLCGRIDHTKKMKEGLLGELQRDGFYEMYKLIRLVR